MPSPGVTQAIRSCTPLPLTSKVAVELRRSVTWMPCSERSSTTGPASPPPSLKLAPASKPEEPRLDVLSSPEPRLLSRLKLESTLGVSVRLLSPPGLSVSELSRFDPVSSEDEGVLKPESMLDVGASGSKLEDGSLSDGGVSGVGVRLSGVGLSRSGVIGELAERSGTAGGLGVGAGAGAGTGLGFAISGTGAGAGVGAGGTASGSGVGAATGAGLGLATLGAGTGGGVGAGAAASGVGAGVAAVRSGAPDPGEGLLGAPTDGELSADGQLVGAGAVEVDMSAVGAEASDGIDDALADAVSDGAVVSEAPLPLGCRASADASGASVGPV
jgi:hypothetical protein